MINLQMEADQVPVFRSGWLRLFRKNPENKYFYWNYTAFQHMTQEEREVVAVCIKTNKTNGEIADALEYLWNENKGQDQ